MDGSRRTEAVTQRESSIDQRLAMKMTKKVIPVPSNLVVLVLVQPFPTEKFLLKDHPLTQAIVTQSHIQWLL